MPAYCQFSGRYAFIFRYCMQYAMEIRFQDDYNYEIRNLPDMSDRGLIQKKRYGYVTTFILQYITKKLTDKGFQWLLPVILSKSTDPLWPDPGASIEKRIQTEI